MKKRNSFSLVPFSLSLSNLCRYLVTTPKRNTWTLRILSQEISIVKCTISSGIFSMLYHWSSQCSNFPSLHEEERIFSLCSCSCPSGFHQTSLLSLSSFCLLTALKANATNLRLKNKQKTFLSRGMGKEAVVHIHDGILLSREKERNGAICRDMDGPRNGHMEWKKSEREKQILCISTYMCNLEEWHR